MGPVTGHDLNGTVIAIYSPTDKVARKRKQQQHTGHGVSVSTLLVYAQCHCYLEGQATLLCSCLKAAPIRILQSWRVGREYSSVESFHDLETEDMLLSSSSSTC